MDTPQIKPVINIADQINANIARWSQVWPQVGFITSDIQNLALKELTEVDLQIV